MRQVGNMQKSVELLNELGKQEACSALMVQRNNLSNVIRTSRDCRSVASMK